jgi:hypothetical protein
LFLLLITRIALADPTVSATLASDGHYTLRIVSDSAWNAAELKVMGGETTDLGPNKVDEVVLVEGWTDEQRSLRISLAAACVDGRGRTWMFEVEPFRVPAKVPELTPKRRAWPFGGRR